MTAKRGSRVVQVHFYRIIVNNQREPLVKLDVTDVQARLDVLDWKESTAKSRYYANADGDVFMAWSYLLAGRLRMTVGKELPDASPAYEKEGAFNIATLDEKSRWVAPTYCVLFPEKSIVGIIFSHEGPRVAAILRYLEGAVGVPVHVDLELIVRDDIDAELRKIKSVRRITLQYHPALTPSLFHAGHDDLDATMNAFVNMREAATIKIEISAEKGASLSKLRDNIINLVRRGPFGAKTSKFIVSGPDHITNRNHRIDLLTSELSAFKSVALAESAKSLDRDSAYQAIEEAYAERLTEFPSVQIQDG